MIKRFVDLYRSLIWVRKLCKAKFFFGVLIELEGTVPGFSVLLFCGVDEVSECSLVVLDSGFSFISIICLLTSAEI